MKRVRGWRARSSPLFSLIDFRSSESRSPCSFSFLQNCRKFLKIYFIITKRGDHPFLRCFTRALLLCYSWLRKKNVHYRVTSGAIDSVHSFDRLQTTLRESRESLLNHNGIRKIVSDFYSQRFASRFPFPSKQTISNELSKIRSMDRIRINCVATSSNVSFLRIRAEEPREKEAAPTEEEEEEEEEGTKGQKEGGGGRGGKARASRGAIRESGFKRGTASRFQALKRKTSGRTPAEGGRGEETKKQKKKRENPTKLPPSLPPSLQN